MNKEPGPREAAPEMTESLIKETIRQIRTAKIEEPVGDQYVDTCQWSRTGWAIWNKDGGCTCRPAKKPQIEIIHD
jgi:hypothetical protein